MIIVFVFLVACNLVITAPIPDNTENVEMNNLQYINSRSLPVKKRPCLMPPKRKPSPTRRPKRPCPALPPKTDPPPPPKTDPPPPPKTDPPTTTDPPPPPPPKTDPPPPPPKKKSILSSRPTRKWLNKSTSSPRPIPDDPFLPPPIMPDPSWSAPPIMPAWPSPKEENKSPCFPIFCQ
ncbi:sulfated surface glycoprotein 185-like [Tribolium madens]|uniref:sulfated surface glycoprotein 185-like n=1 Tax=Tribolium madens TaxID=41895 RepID=UPI001CF74940|nr:sulfated surface glycoprotein 185-like [Tribolium madens]